MSGNHLQLFETAEKKMYVCVLMTPLCYLWRRNEVEEKAKDSKNHHRDAKCVQILYVYLCGGLCLQSPRKVYDLARESWRGSTNARNTGRKGKKNECE